jgi:multidrug efflux pump subunit AcrB
MLTITVGFMGVVWIYQETGKPLDSTAWVGLIILAGIVVNNSILLIAHINERVHQAQRAGGSIHGAIAAACKDRLRPILLTALTTLIGLLPLLDEFVRSMQTMLLDLFTFVGLPNWGSELLSWFKGSEGDQANRGLDMTIAMFSSLSRSTVGGMLSATLGTLLISPVLYLLFFRLKQWIHQRIEEIAHAFGNLPSGLKGPAESKPGEEKIHSAGANLL